MATASLTSPATTDPAAAATPFPLPKILTYPSASSPELITQGAEGRLYRTTFLAPGTPCALKHRPSKPYRHPVLDARLTRQRILAEARVLARCRREGVRVPAVYAVDEAAGWMMMEWIEGRPVRAAVNEWLGPPAARGAGSSSGGKRKRGADAPREGTVDEGEEKTTPATGQDADESGEREGSSESLEAEEGRDPEELAGLMRRVGRAVGAIHKVGVVHGDLTTSNMMLKPLPQSSAGANGDAGKKILDGEIWVIDFGLASQSTSDEDRAVDLYVLERAFGSTHPRAESLFDEVLQAYKESFKQTGPVLKKLEEVRMRGRKRSMLG
ncbi:uncharacterized protein E0L32_012084 [Thyridium curvatum]|uniref:EKC/KEOPS complex subunit BUD32 n=1 Tax=Thyridium curvatum TaxID=1093900 RepID=A0A507BFQ7_9PEZI|nr:uncharacterized protein E0L32_012084 [Thyridium curvatum]TPX17604.1 hypothetical protein E0L32_012084 [Thyridium curvatum]